MFVHVDSLPHPRFSALARLSCAGSSTPGAYVFRGYGAGACATSQSLGLARTVYPLFTAKHPTRAASHLLSDRGVVERNQLIDHS